MPARRALWIGSSRAAKPPRLSCAFLRSRWICPGSEPPVCDLHVLGIFLASAPSAPQPLAGSRGCARAEKAIEHQVGGVGPELHDPLDQRQWLLGRMAAGSALGFG